MNQDHLHMKFFFDYTLSTLAKLLANHNLEFLVEMRGRLGEAACYTMQVSQVFPDMLIGAYLFNMCLARSGGSHVQHFHANKTLV